MSLPFTAMVGRTGDRDDDSLAFSVRGLVLSPYRLAAGDLRVPQGDNVSSLALAPADRGDLLPLPATRSRLYIDSAAAGRCLGPAKNSSIST